MSRNSRSTATGERITLSHAAPDLIAVWLGPHRLAMHFFIFGPSGVGKTWFGDWIGKREYLHIPIDRGDQGNGLELEVLDHQFNQLRQGDPVPFVQSLDARATAAGKLGCVLTFWSTYCCSPEEIAYLGMRGIAVWYLYAPKEKCIEASHRRETENGHPERGRSYWCEHNPTYERMGGHDLAPHRVYVLDASGDYLPSAEIARTMKMVRR
jgi:hypothetical protein